MTTEVKICGLKTAVAMDAALAAGADHVGLVFYPRSPRNVSLAVAAELADRARGRAKVVALLVDADDAMVTEVARVVRPDIFQLHGHEPPDRVAAIERHSGRAVMKAISVSTADDVSAAAAYLAATAGILFDAKAPQDLARALPGGNGLTFDWRLLGAWKHRWFMLSGGLNASNVAEAIRMTGAPAVDVSSGVESTPGEKDAALIHAFVRAAKLT